jgi:hypothetical protein
MRLKTREIKRAVELSASVVGKVGEYDRLKLRRHKNTLFVESTNGSYNCSYNIPCDFADDKELLHPIFIQAALFSKLLSAESADQVAVLTTGVKLKVVGNYEFTVVYTLDGWDIDFEAKAKETVDEIEEFKTACIRYQSKNTLQKDSADVYSAISLYANADGRFIGATDKFAISCCRIDEIASKKYQVSFVVPSNVVAVLVKQEKCSLKVYKDRVVFSNNEFEIGLSNSGNPNSSIEKNMTALKASPVTFQFNGEDALTPVKAINKIGDDVKTISISTKEDGLRLSGSDSLGNDFHATIPVIMGKEIMFKALLDTQKVLDFLEEAEGVVSVHNGQGNIKFSCGNLSLVVAQRSVR